MDTYNLGVGNVILFNLHAMVTFREKVIGKHYIE